MTRIFLFDENDQIFERTEISDETIEALRSVDWKEDDQIDFIEKMDAERLGTCKVCGSVVKVGWKGLIENPDFVKGENSRYLNSGEAVCREHVISGNQKNSDYPMYRDRKAIREERNKEAREKNEARLAKFKRWEDAGFKVCDRCGGYGIIDAFKHVNGGICFECGGEGKLPMSDMDYKMMHQAQEKKQEEKGFLSDPDYQAHLRRTQ